MPKSQENNSKKIILVGGCFDILHYGHVHFLREAKSLGDYLIIALESDKNIQRLKGAKRPIHNQNQRQEMLESLAFVDQVIVLADSMHDDDYKKLVLTVNPNIIAITKGDPMVDKKKSHAKEVNAEVIEIEKIDTPSTTQIAKILDIEV